MLSHSFWAWVPSSDLSLIAVLDTSNFLYSVSILSVCKHTRIGRTYVVREWVSCYSLAICKHVLDSLSALYTTIQIWPWTDSMPVCTEPQANFCQAVCIPDSLQMQSLGLFLVRGWDMHPHYKDVKGIVHKCLVLLKWLYKCVSKTQYTRHKGVGSWNYVQHPHPFFLFLGAISPS